MPKKVIAPQFELPGCAEIFSLRGETAIQSAPEVRATCANRTPELIFIDRGETTRLQNIVRREMAFGNL